MHIEITSKLAGRHFEGDVPDVGLEEIFRFFNRVEEADSDRLSALGYRLPSMSTGDLVTIPTGTYRVEPVGWKRVTEPEALAEKLLIARTAHEAGRVEDEVLLHAENEVLDFLDAPLDLTEQGLAPEAVAMLDGFVERFGSGGKGA